MFLLVIYLIATIAWSLVLVELGKTLCGNIKYKVEHPPLLIPLTVATLSVVLESLYFGVSAYFHIAGDDMLFNATLQEQYWLIPKLFIAISGILLFFRIKRKN